MVATTDVEFVRFLISDADSAVFSDTEIEMVITRQPAVYLAGALLLERIADNESLIAKRITSQNLAVDGPAVAKDLRESAKNLRAEHDRQVAADSAGDASIAIVEFDPYAGIPAHPELVPWVS